MCFKKSSFFFGLNIFNCKNEVEIGLENTSVLYGISEKQCQSTLNTFSTLLYDFWKRILQVMLLIMLVYH